jgi:xanthine dehydrogenase accessory factor
MKLNNEIVIIRGGGDLASGVAVRLFNAGFKVLILEINQPLAIRLPVSFARAAYEEKAVIEGIEADLARSEADVEKIIRLGKIAVLVDPEGDCIKRYSPAILIDAILAKRNLGTRKGQASLVIGLGPGFNAGVDIDVVVETKRGHDLGRVIYQGSAKSDTGIPGQIKGESIRRLLRAPIDGRIIPVHHIGNLVKYGEMVAQVEGVPLRTKISGVLRGLVYPNIRVIKGMKVGDVDPRGVREYCFTISDKARSVGGGVLEAICYYLSRLK